MEAKQKIEVEKINDYEVHLKLGDGGQSEVFMIETKKVFYAAKVFKTRKSFEREVFALQSTDSLNVVKLIQFLPEAKIFFRRGYCETKPTIILEFAARGDLFDMISETKRISKIPPHVCRAKLIDILQALSETHSKGLAHRDLKPQNLVFDEQFTLKLTDYGLSTNLEGEQGDGNLHDKIGSSEYWAPEIFKGKYKGATSDIFSMGIIFFILCFGTIPFKSTKINDEFYKFFRDGSIEENNKFWQILTRGKNNVDPDLKWIFCRIFDSDPERRPTIEELLDCAWLKKEVATIEQVKEHFQNKYRVMLKNKPQRQTIVALLSNQKKYYD